MTQLPLEGIRVADFSWFGAGPIAAQTLATFGADVVRVESETKIDSLRVVQPFALNEDGSFKTGYNVSGYFNNFNANKRSITLNLNAEKGQELALKIVEKSDVFLTNFTPRIVERWNLRYEQLAAVNPRIIAAYAPMMGLEGPFKDFLGFGAVLTPISGISHLSGYPDREPFGVGTNYPDYVVNPGHTATAILAALRYRNRTGKGQKIELPQVESVGNVLGSAVADYLVNGNLQTRRENRHPVYAPQGAYRCADDGESVNSPDRWVAIACRDDAEWRATAEVLAPNGVDGAFGDAEARRARHDELDALISGWVRERRAEEVVEALQARGVPAGVVQNAQDMLDRDPHMKARGYYEYLDHPETGRAAYDGPVARLSATPVHHRNPAPLLGEHTMEICEELLDLTPDEIADLLAESVLI